MIISVFKRPHQRLAPRQPFVALVGPDRLIPVFSVKGGNIGVARRGFGNGLFKGGDLSLRRQRNSSAQQQAAYARNPNNSLNQMERQHHLVSFARNQQYTFVSVFRHAVYSQSL